MKNSIPAHGAVYVLLPLKYFAFTSGYTSEAVVVEPRGIQNLGSDA